MISQKHIPYTVIGGYLGAGKTTLLNNLLRNSKGLRLAVLVNDFGAINIDADLIVSHDGETMELASGCICCSLADGFLVALNRLRDHAERLDHLVVEASGVSDPLKIGYSGAILRYDLDGVIVVIDAEQIRTRATNKYVGELVVRQLKGADLLVLNKTDLVSPAELAELRAWLAAVAPGARIYATSYGQVPLPVLFGAHELAGSAAGSDVSPRPEPEEEHDLLYQTCNLRIEQPVLRAQLEALAASLPEGVLRSKGFVRLAEDPVHRYVFQLVGRRWTLVQAALWGDQNPSTTLVFIGVPGSLDEQALAQALVAAQAD